MAKTLSPESTKVLNSIIEELSIAVERRFVTEGIVKISLPVEKRYLERPEIIALATMALCPSHPDMEKPPSSVDVLNPTKDEYRKMDSYLRSHHGRAWLDLGHDRGKTIRRLDSLLSEAIQRGEIQLRDPQNKLPGYDLDDGVVNRRDFIRFVSELDIDVVATDEIIATEEQATQAPEMDGENKPPPAIATDKVNKWDVEGSWEKKARAIGQEWMLEQRKLLKEADWPGVVAIAKHVEGELSTRKITGKRGKYPDWAYIKRDALTGITERKAKGKK